MTGRRDVRAAVAGALALLLAAASACSAGAPAKSTRPVNADKRFVTPVGPTDGHLLGLKWNWRQTGTLRYAAEVAGGATFFEVEWCKVEPEAGRRDWGRVDEVVATTASLRYELMLKIRTGACWATSGRGPELAAAAPEAGGENARKRPSSLPADLAAYETFVQDLVRRYAARGVHLYAIENEIDTRNLWGGTADDYTRLARVGAAAVREADPSATVYDAGLSSSAYGTVMAADLLEQGRPDDALQLYRDYYRRRQDGGASRFPTVSDVRDLRQVVASDAGQRAVTAADSLMALTRDGTFDVYQLHFYEPWELAPVVLEHVRERTSPQVRIQAWEVGLAWPGSSYDEQQHADELSRLLVTLLGAGVERAVYLPLAYTPGSGRAQVFRGLVEPDGRRLAAAEAYEQIAVASAGATGVAPVEVGELRGVAFAVPSGTRTVLWSDTGEDVLLEPGAGQLSNPGAAVASDQGTVVVGAAPALLSWTVPPDEVLDVLSTSAGP